MICVLLHGSINNDERVIKTVNFLSQYKHVDVFYLGEKALGLKKKYNKNVRFFAIKYPLGLLKKIQRHSVFYKEFDFLADVVFTTNKRYKLVWANDLPTLWPAVQIAKRYQSKLIYDSHEIYVETLNQFFNTDSFSLPKKGLTYLLINIMKSLGERAERKLIKNIDHFITVNTSLASYFEKKYAYQSVKVLMNCPEKTKELKGFDFRKYFSWKQSDRIFLYQGILNKGRGLEDLVLAMAKAPSDFKLLILGDGMLKPKLLEIVSRFNLQGRIKFFGMIPQEDLANYTCGADFGINLLEGFNLSKKMASPNKLFQYIHAGLPCICSDTIENRKVFEKYEIGLLTNNKIKSITQCMEKIAVSENIETYKKNCRLAREEYNWENQSKLFSKLLAY